MSEKEKRIVVPGDEIGVIEEFLPKYNCYEKDGIIISENWGEVKVDSKKHQVRVIPTQRIQKIQRGTVAIGYITEIRRQKANVTLIRFRFKNERDFKDIKATFPASLHISNMSDRYTRSIHDGVRPGDYVICKIISTNPDYRISLTGSRELGVIHAACFVCGAEVNRVVKRNLVRCNSCGATQNRILGNEFGKFERYFPREE